MTDNDYASIVYCRVFNAEKDDGDSYTRGILDAIGTLSPQEQKALESYYRDGNSYKLTGQIIGDISGDAARRIVQKALVKLRHPTRLKRMSVKSMITERDEIIAEVTEILDDLCIQFDRFVKKAIITGEVQKVIDSQKNSICDIGFSSRVHNHLIDAGINTIEDLLALDTLDMLMKRRNFGDSSKQEIIQKMRQHNYVHWADKMDTK